VTVEEYIVEWQYRYHERLGILIQGDRDSTGEEKEIARKEADAACEKLKGL